MIYEMYDLNSEINRLVKSQGTDADKKRFREGVDKHIKSKQKDIAIKGICIILLLIMLLMTPLPAIVPFFKPLKAVASSL